MLSCIKIEYDDVVGWWWWWWWGWVSLEGEKVALSSLSDFIKNSHLLLPICFRLFAECKVIGGVKEIINILGLWRWRGLTFYEGIPKIQFLVAIFRLVGWW